MVFGTGGVGEWETDPGAVRRRSARQLVQRGAVGAQQENRLDVIAAGLFQRQRGQLAVGNTPFGHHATSRQGKRTVNLGAARFRHSRIAPGPAAW
ncbi:hypothetical protein HmCmsJML041_04063 [Escherichia coli]|nr:hypothetical protein HmCmsJML041_04063 [Escherichia coli]